VIGRVEVPGQRAVFLRCLTYPLAQVWGTFNLATGSLGEFQGLVRVPLTAFPLIARVGDSKLKASERAIVPASAPWAPWAPSPEGDELDHRR
jgi:hypothetical protein